MVILTFRTGATFVFIIYIPPPQFLQDSPDIYFISLKYSFEKKFFAKIFEKI
jgi:hypothetical protein